MPHVWGNFSLKLGAKALEPWSKYINKPYTDICCGLRIEQVTMAFKIVSKKWHVCDHLESNASADVNKPNHGKWNNTICVQKNIVHVFFLMKTKRFVQVLYTALIGQLTGSKIWGLQKKLICSNIGHATHSLHNSGMFFWYRVTSSILCLRFSRQ